MTLVDESRQVIELKIYDLSFLSSLKTSHPLPHVPEENVFRRRTNPSFDIGVLTPHRYGGIDWRWSEGDHYFGSHHSPTRTQHYARFRRDERVDRDGNSQSDPEDSEDSCGLREDWQPSRLVWLNALPGYKKYDRSSSSWLGKFVRSKHYYIFFDYGSFISHVDLQYRAWRISPGHNQDQSGVWRYVLSFLLCMWYPVKLSSRVHSEYPGYVTRGKFEHGRGKVRTPRFYWGKCRIQLVIYWPYLPVPFPSWCRIPTKKPARLRLPPNTRNALTLWEYVWTTIRRGSNRPSNRLSRTRKARYPLWLRESTIFKDKSRNSRDMCVL